MTQSITQLISQVAKEIGFIDIKFASTKPLIEEEQRFFKWRESGYAAGMDYLLKADPINARPEKLLEDAKSIIMLTANYYSPCPPKPEDGKQYGRISSYATGLDYHKVLKKKIKELVEHPKLKKVFEKARFFTDAVPLLEKSFAIEAGLGFRAKNSLLLSRDSGSFNFILELVTDIDFDVASSPRHILSSTLPLTTCGGCTRCADICPTSAFPEPYVLDSNKCISYWTIETKDKEIPPELSSKFGDWLFGCDLCQTICPYNGRLERKEILPKAFSEFNPENGFGHWLDLDEILDLELGKFSLNELKEKLETHKFLDKATLPTIQKYLDKQNELSDEVLDHVFQLKFARTALLRPKRKGLIRNAKNVLNNSHKSEFTQA